jgi:hypothetical protein
MILFCGENRQGINESDGVLKRLSGKRFLNSTPLIGKHPSLGELQVELLTSSKVESQWHCVGCKVRKGRGQTHPDVPCERSFGSDPARGLNVPEIGVQDRSYSGDGFGVPDAVEKH